MPVIRKNPIILVQNNTDNIQPVSLFTTLPNLFGSINGNPVYQWDITAQSLVQLTTVSLQVKTPGSPVYVSLSAPIPTSDLQGITDALNSLNVGPFRLMVQGSSIFVYTYNSLFVFGNLDINTAAVSFLWKTTGGFQINALFAPIVASVVFTDLNSAVILSSASATPPVPPQFIPTVASISYPLSSLNAGDTINFVISAFTGPQNFSIVLKENGVPIFTFSGLTNLVANPFTYTADAVYDLTASSN